MDLLCKEHLKQKYFKLLYYCKISFENLNAVRFNAKEVIHLSVDSESGHRSTFNDQNSLEITTSKVDVPFRNVHLSRCSRVKMIKTDLQIQQPYTMPFLQNPSTQVTEENVAPDEEVYSKS